MAASNWPVSSPAPAANTGNCANRTVANRSRQLDAMVSLRKNANPPTRKGPVPDFTAQKKPRRSYTKAPGATSVVAEARVQAGQRVFPPQPRTAALAWQGATYQTELRQKAMQHSTIDGQRPAQVSHEHRTFNSAARPPDTFGHRRSRRVPRPAGARGGSRHLAGARISCRRAALRTLCRSRPDVGSRGSPSARCEVPGRDCRPGLRPAALLAPAREHACAVAGGERAEHSLRTRFAKRSGGVEKLARHTGATPLAAVRKHRPSRY